MPPAVSPLTRRSLLFGGAFLATLLGWTSSAWSTDLAPGPTTRVADPKLQGGGFEVGFYLSPIGEQARVIVEALDGGGLVLRQISNQVHTGSSDPISVFWDGRDAQGKYVDVGTYTVRTRLSPAQGAPLEQPVSIVRLGVTEVEARSSSPRAIQGQADEYQMVYFKRNAQIAYYVTPAIHEYASKAPAGQVSDLDLDNGDPRPTVPVHTATDQPVMDGSNYATNAYNYPLCYRMGTRPRLALVFGSTSTSASGALQGVGYPLPGIQIRAKLSDELGEWTAVEHEVLPGGEALFDGPALPDRLARVDRSVVLRFECSEDGGVSWRSIPGSSARWHRFYTTYAAPIFAPGDAGQQYAGPWVEVLDYAAKWADGLGMAANNDKSVVAAMIRGFFGQEGSLPTAIEGVRYDAYPMGGDGGANHYFNNSQHRIDLSALLNNHANGIFVNCSDCAGSTSAMISMLGVPNVQLVHLGGMTLKAIWGIGASAYTTNLWGGGNHGFSYHKIITRDAAVHVSDACMWLDADGSPTSTPGIPGHNADRLWAGVPHGYDYLSSYNNVSRTLQALPKIR